MFALDIACYLCNEKRNAEWVVVTGCLDQMHVAERYVCGHHARYLTNEFAARRLYCKTCHHDGLAVPSEWVQLVPVADLVVARL
jgi:hypothetical protein